MAHPWSTKKRDLDSLLKHASKERCATCNGWPWSCRCGRTALDMTLWLKKVSDDVVEYTAGKLAELRD